MKKILLIAAMIFTLITTSCSIFNLISPQDLCYEVGRVTAYEYVTSGGTSDPTLAKAVESAWRGFDKAVIDFNASGAKPSEFPELVKKEIAKLGLPPTLASRADGFVDAAWVKFKTVTKVDDNDLTAFLVNVNALRNGIEDGIYAGTKK